MTTDVSTEHSSFIVRFDSVRFLGLLGLGPSSFYFEDQDIAFLKGSLGSYQPTWPYISEGWNLREKYVTVYWVESLNLADPCLIKYTFLIQKLGLRDEKPAN
jgi:hypothetical protein